MRSAMQPDQKSDRAAVIDLISKRHFDAALERAQALAQRDGPDAEALALLGDVYRFTARNEEAEISYARALDIDETCDPALQGLAAVRFKGPDYYEVLRWLHRWLRPATYVEIGVEFAHSLALAGPETKCIGIDPAPDVQITLSANTRIFSLESDDFFERYSLTSELGGLLVDLAFIDGLHHFDQVLRDFASLERCCAPNALVLLHDVLPLNAFVASRQRRSKFWTGDVWKAIVCLRDLRPDLKIFAIPCAPSGLGVVGGLDPSSSFSQHDLGSVTAAYETLELPESEHERQELVGTIPDWPTIRAHIADLAGVSGDVDWASNNG